eukprot:scaffold92723_cov40-Cyclotella_meneghiniana.AAC.1
MVMHGWWRLLVAHLYLGYSLLAALPALLMGFREFVFKLATECFQLPRSRPPPDPDSTVQLRFGFLWSCLPFVQFLWRQTIFPSLFSYVLLQWMTMISFNVVHGNFGFWCAWVMQLPILALLVGIWLMPLAHWTEFLLSKLLVQRRSHPVSLVPCLYSGRWYIPHRRRRRRGESSIRMPRIYTMPSSPSVSTLFLLVLLWLVCFIGSVLRRLGTVFAWLGSHLPTCTPISPFLSTSPGPWRRHWPIPSVEVFLGFSPLPFRVKLVDDGDFDLEEFIDDSSDPVSDELTDALDDLFFGRLDLEQSLFDLCKAGYHFTFGWTVTEEVSWGIIRWRVRDASGQIRVLDVPGYHFSSPNNSGVRLLSPQLLTQGGKGSFHSDDGYNLDICLKDGFTLRGTIDPNGTNLPQLPLASNSDAQQYSTVGVDTLDVPSSPSSYEFGFNVMGENNVNLTASQKELLLWHQRLSHVDINQVQSLLQSRDRLKASDDNDNALHSGPILSAVNVGVTRCDVSKVKCAACLLAKAKRRTPDSTRGYQSKPPDNEMLLKRNHLRPGQCLSCDHYVSPVKGRRVDGYGKRTKFDGYVGGAIYVDHVSANAKIFHHPQASLSAADTLRGKQVVEQEAHDLGRKIESYHSDNGIFAQKEFKDHCEHQKQKLSFCGVGAHHQNGIAEINIKTVCNLARANLIHLMLMWPEKCNVNLWTLAINYAVWIFNRLPKASLGGLSPNEPWSGVRSDYADLRRAH